MLRVSIDINGDIMDQIHCVRTKPKTKTIKEGTVCTYNVVYNGVTVDIITGAYGCGVNLAIQLLEKLKENRSKYKKIAMIKLTEDMKNDKQV